MIYRKNLFSKIRLRNNHNLHLIIKKYVRKNSNKKLVIIDLAPQKIVDVCLIKEEIDFDLRVCLSN